MMVFLYSSPEWLLILEESKGTKMVPAHRGTESYLKCLNVVPCGVKLMLKKNEIFHMAKLFICQFYTGLGIWHCTEHL